MYKKIFIITLVSVAVLAVQAQENLQFGQRKEIVSPEIHPDNSVTFRLRAPHAQNVEVAGDFLPPKG